MPSNPLELPPDLLDHLRSGRRLHYPAEKCEAGSVELRPLADLQLATFGACCSGFPEGEYDPNAERPGVYRVPAFDLIASCSSDYEPTGLLVWLPAERRYGVCDIDHDLIFAFPASATWSVIARAPYRYINAQWAFDELDRAEAELLVPWPKYPFDG